LFASYRPNTHARTKRDTQTHRPTALPSSHSDAERGRQKGLVSKGPGESGAQPQLSVIFVQVSYLCQTEEQKPVTSCCIDISNGDVREGAPGASKQGSRVTDCCPIFVATEPTCLLLTYLLGYPNPRKG